MEPPEFSSDSNPLARPPRSGSYLHIEVCEISIYPTGRWGDRQSVKRTLDPSPTSVRDVGVNHCRAHVIMSEKFLNCSYIRSSSRRCVAKEWRKVSHPGILCQTCLTLLTTNSPDVSATPGSHSKGDTRGNLLIRKQDILPQTPLGK